MSCFTTNITHISAGLVYKRCAFSKRFNTMAEPGTLIFRNNTCVKKVKEKIISKKNSIRTSEKICPTFFKIQGTYFKIGQTYFWPLQNPHEQRLCGTCKMQTKAVGRKDPFPESFFLKPLFKKLSFLPHCHNAGCTHLQVALWKRRCLCKQVCRHCRKS